MIVTRGEISVSKYKIIAVKDGFSVWKLQDFGIGYAWEDMGRGFRTEDDAQRFVEKERGKGMSPADKAKETRRRHEEARRAKDQERIEITEKLKKSCLSLMDDLRLTPGERLEATKILHDLTKGR